MIRPSDVTTPPAGILKPTDVINNRWAVKHRIGSGGFGEIYEVQDVCRILQDNAAIKVCLSKVDAAMALKMESLILKQLQRKGQQAALLKQLISGEDKALSKSEKDPIKSPSSTSIAAPAEYKHFCKYIESGRTPVCNYLVMSLCGKNLSELRRGINDETRFSPSTTFRIGLQILKAISDLHGVGFLHRDIKPSNFCLGRGDAKRTIFVLDFGLARKYTTRAGKIKEPREHAGFRGTLRYASITTHQSKDMGRKDDIWSMFYMMVEFLVSVLPWRKLETKEKVLECKLATTADSLLHNLEPRIKEVMVNFEALLKPLEYESQPPYVQIRALFRDILTEMKVNAEDNFDWENVFRSPAVLANAIKTSISSAVFGQGSKSRVKEYHTDPEFDDGEVWDVE